ncbi:hypothetical protein GB931_19790 [Modestobacter sp. I12A-02628]|uniref:Uncharacterized protein n=1 Tax=Goekera deserti TaxID=2497753 RepID=A0A7K3WFV6_9ACTN|nr:hypothetical protein [Goekera deserti]MPR00121.1 hypothetical protein [Goekera deserti]NDI49900.1 hypothetical protein [Goekera deserti]NEL55262.1 hypothetical protein [Goekera deserti]
MDVYLLWHMRPLEGQEELDPEVDPIETDDKLCGVFSSEAQAEAARRQLIIQPGFIEYPDDFYLGAHPLDEITWTEGFT